jgi:hypothetical protein
LLRRWIDDDRDGEAAALGMAADVLLERTDELKQDAEHRVRLLVRGFLDVLG